MSGTKKLRILCLHGFYQNGSVFRSKTGSFRKYFKKLADFEFVDAPHKVEVDVFAQEEAAKNKNNENNTTTTTTITTITTTTEETGKQTTVVNTVTTPQDNNNNNNNNNNNKQQNNKEDDNEKEANGNDLGPLAWWHTVPDWLTTPVYPGVDQSIETVAKFIKENGPFDGLLGFSQGGVFASILSNTNQFNFKFVIICSAFVPSIPEFKKGEGYNTIPSLHFYGKGDTLVMPEYGRLLSSHFLNPITFEHKGGHFVPTDADSKKIFREFFEKFLKE